MTTLTARAAGVQEIVVASPRPHPVTLWAASLGGASALLPVGGAQGVAALAYGLGTLPGCDMVVGPGNRFVTAAKHLVSRDVGIDMLAGPSELVVLADKHADPCLVAADLLAQAEHDTDAIPVLVTTSRKLAGAVQAAIGEQLADLSTAETARTALRNGGIVLCASLAEAVDECNRLAPEHLALQVSDPRALEPRLTACGAIFVGARSAEVLGDYGSGPNHVLPTGGHARQPAQPNVLARTC
jgi:phosphoribosyl-ATP pyrophosphohydrolase/phosphoribosyl-AMP cyclohydrolase/histidinol dehydrogenase